MPSVSILLETSSACFLISLFHGCYAKITVISSICRDKINAKNLHPDYCNNLIICKYEQVHFKIVGFYLLTEISIDCFVMSIINDYINFSNLSCSKFRYERAREKEKSVSILIASPACSLCARMSNKRSSSRPSTKSFLNFGCILVLNVS